nr:MAG TPA: hypothetical protein [Caudoviricetes sp.]
MYHTYIYARIRVFARKEIFGVVVTGLVSLPVPPMDWEWQSERNIHEHST